MKPNWALLEQLIAIGVVDGNRDWQWLGYNNDRSMCYRARETIVDKKIYINGISINDYRITELD